MAPQFYPEQVRSSRCDDRKGRREHPLLRANKLKRIVSNINVDPIARGSATRLVNKGRATTILVLFNRLASAASHVTIDAADTAVRCPANTSVRVRNLGIVSHSPECLNHFKQQQNDDD